MPPRRALVAPIEWVTALSLSSPLDGRFFFLSSTEGTSYSSLTSLLSMVLRLVMKFLNTFSSQVTSFWGSMPGKIWNIVSSIIFQILKGKYLCRYSSVFSRLSITGRVSIILSSRWQAALLISIWEYIIANSSYCFFTRDRVVLLSIQTRLSMLWNSSVCRLN